MPRRHPARTPEPGRQPSFPSLLCNLCGCRPTDYIKGRPRAGGGDGSSPARCEGAAAAPPGAPRHRHSAARGLAGPASLPLSSSSHSTLWGRGAAAAAGFPPRRCGGQPGGQSSSAGRREGRGGRLCPRPAPAAPLPSLGAVQPSDSTFPTGACFVLEKGLSGKSRATESTGFVVCAVRGLC